VLLEIKDKSLPVRVFLDVDRDDEESIENIADAIAEDINFWLYEVEISDTGESGYEIEGEVRLLVSE
jgi:hypothetical protein